MISYELTEEQQIIQSTMSEFARQELAPHTRRLDDAETIDAELLGMLWATEIIQAQFSGEAGERSPVTNAIILEELGAAEATLAMAVASTLGFIGAIADQGTIAQRKELFDQFKGNEFHAAAVAIMEPTFGFDVSNLTTKAAKCDKGYSLNGKKVMVPMAGRCSHFLVLAEIDGVPDAFIVSSDTPGISIGEAESTLGLRALELANVTFEDVVISRSMRLGEDQGADVQRIIDSSRVAIAAIMTGVGRGVRDYVIPYTKDRIVHGTPLARKQAIAFMIADMHMAVEGARWMTWKAAWELENGLPSTKQAQLAFTHAGQEILVAGDNGLQMLGGHGYTKGHPVELWYRNLRAISLLEGCAGV